MQGPDILVRSMSVPQPTGSSGSLWQYHSRSDRHSKVACWGVLFDLLRTSALFQSHAAETKVIFGVNFTMRDFHTRRKKKLDLVVSRPSGQLPAGATVSLADLAAKWGILLTPEQSAELEGLPGIVEGPVTGAGVLLALEAKATMTAHGKARPRLYDELNSSQSTVHGASEQALAVGLVMINAGPTFISPDRQRDGRRDVVSIHRQPADAGGVVEKVEELPRRSGRDELGFDGIGIVLVDMANDGSPVSLVKDPPAPQPGEVFFYDDMITRVANEYDSRFARI
jgi:hypothetical protein